MGFWLAALAGAALVVAYALRHGGGGTFAAGDLLLIFAVASGGIGYTLCGRLSLAMPGWEVILLGASGDAAPGGRCKHCAVAGRCTDRAPRGPWMGLAYVAFMSQWLAFFAWNAGMALAGIARVERGIQLLQTFVTVALAAWVNHETARQRDHRVRGCGGSHGADRSTHADRYAERSLEENTPSSRSRAARPASSSNELTIDQTETAGGHGVRFGIAIFVEGDLQARYARRSQNIFDEPGRRMAIANCSSARTARRCRRHGDRRRRSSMTPVR